jgi:hypothetical protein
MESYSIDTYAGEKQSQGLTMKLKQSCCLSYLIDGELYVCLEKMLKLKLVKHHNCKVILKKITKQKVAKIETNTTFQVIVSPKFD